MTLYCVELCLETLYTLYLHHKRENEIKKCLKLISIIYSVNVTVILYRYNKPRFGKYPGEELKKSLNISKG
jgi:hypothetical protein